MCGRTAVRQTGTGGPGRGGRGGRLWRHVDGNLLIPEGRLVFVCGCHRCRGVVARGSGGWGALEEELSDGEWELPGHIAPIRFEGNKGSSLLLRVCRLPYTLQLLVYMVLAEG